MGSWANSLHVRHADPQAVADAIRAIVLSGEYQLSTAPSRTAAVNEAADPDRDDEEIDADDLEAFGAPEPRNIAVYRPVNGWVGVLDSGEVHDLAAELSARLHTDALLVMVNDSDGWVYGLYRDGEEHDNFSSLGDEEHDGDVSPELQAAMDRGDEAEVERLMMREVMAHMPTGPVTMPFAVAGMPPAMARIRGRMLTGQAWFWERWYYRWLWLRFMFQVITGRWQPGEPEEMGFDVPRSTPLDPAALTRHVERLREFFPAADEAALRRLLPRSRFPAEHLLADFLDIVGLPRRYADLSYSYLPDFSERELAVEGVVRVATLHFDPRS